MAAMEKRALGSNESLQRMDRYQWPLGFALAAIGLASFPGVFGRRRLGRSLTAALLLIAIGSCSTAYRDARRGEREYQAGRFRASYDAFSHALEKGGSDPVLQLNAGNALYRMRRYEEAARLYQAAAGASRLRQQSYYNLGNAYVRAAEEAGNPDTLLRQAISAYEEALRLAPGDSAAKWNLELALKRRGDDRESGGSPGRGRSADYGRGNMENSGYEGTPEASVGAMAGGGFGSAEGESAEELSQSQARELLEALEREQLRSHEGRPSPAGRAGERDW
jgi:tetratricopeptide (TPR) repeat protein